MKLARFTVLAALVVCLVRAPAALAAVDPLNEVRELNYYEWTAVAPIVVSGLSLGEAGRYLEFRVDHVLRGDVRPGTKIQLDLRNANRNRRRSDYPEALKMPFGVDFLLVLERPTKGAEGIAIYPLARSVSSARELPAEGQQGILEAVAQFIDTQDERSDSATWRRMAAMLEESNPLVLVTALEQLAKFRRGEPDQLFSLRPLFGHPAPAIREGAIRVAGQIVERNTGGEREPLPEEEALLAELIGLARRDEQVEPRIAATEALAAFGVGRVEAVLQEVASRDPDQNVRYAAERLLFQYHKAQKAQKERPGLQPASH